MLNIITDILRGFALYVLFSASAIVWFFILIPLDIPPHSLRPLVITWGGGALFFLAIVIALFIALN